MKTICLPNRPKTQEECAERIIEEARWAIHVWEGILSPTQHEIDADDMTEIIERLRFLLTVYGETESLSFQPTAGETPL